MKRLAATALTIAAVLVTAGCARAGTPSATPSLSASSAPSTPSTTPTTTPVPTPPAPAGCPSGRADPVQLNDGDDGAVVCLAVGGRVEVYLRGSDDDRWATIGVDGNALEPAPNGKRALQLGVTAGFYAGTRPGTAHLTSARDGRTWRVTVIVG